MPADAYQKPTKLQKLGKGEARPTMDDLASLVDQTNMTKDEDGDEEMGGAVATPAGRKILVPKGAK